MASTGGLEESMKVFFEQNGLDRLNLIILNSDRSLAMEALWIVSNIACDNEESAKKVA